METYKETHHVILLDDKWNIIIDILLDYRVMTFGDILLDDSLIRKDLLHNNG